MRGLSFRHLAAGLGLGMAQLWPTAALAQQAPIINCQGRPVTALDFSGSFLESGTDNDEADPPIYRFTNVAPGVDARIEVLDFVDGGTLNVFDNDTGLVNYFQPELISTGGSAVDFKISFIDSSNTPIALDIAASAIDVDGNGNPNGTLREYAEFERDLSAFVLNAATELDVDASGPSSADRIRFESRTTQFAPGIDPTAENNIVTTFYTDITSFEYRIGTLDTGGGTRLTSLGFDCPNLQSPISTPMVDEDFGDAPLNNYGNPIHTVIPGIQLGASNSADSGPFDSATASGDGGDDGVSPPGFFGGETKTITVDVSGSGGYLQAWIDWNNDGDILDADEQIATNVQDGDSDGQISLSVTAPLSILTGNSIARFRWSTAQNVSFQEAALNGEVEDYQITLTEAAPELAAVKTVDTFDPQDGSEVYMLPGNDVIYSIEISNVGNLATDADTLFLVDSLPSEIEFWSGDLEDGAPDDIPGTDPIALVQEDGAALTFTYLTDIGVSTSATRPTSFADCDPAPTSGIYIPAIRHICFNPKGSLAAGAATPKATFKFRARIK